tara:strand:+ start:319 stop:1758 length:1440 start_codon:yes stop_codon:yes gene_type:complete
MILTRKIELLIAEDDQDKRLDIWKYLRSVEMDTFKAANLIISHQYFNDTFKERILLTKNELKERHQKIENKIEKLTEKLKAEKDKEKKKKLTADRKGLYTQRDKLKPEAREEMVSVYTTSEKNSTYQLISKHFPHMSSYISASLNDMVTKNFSNELFDVKRGDRSLRSYRKGMPIPFMKSGMSFESTDEGIHMNWVNNIKFYLRFGRDASNNRAVMERVLAGEYKMSDSQIQIKKNKIFLLLVVDIPNKTVKLDKKLSVGVDLGINNPAYCALSKGPARFAIGSREDFFRVRVQMQSRRRRLQKNLKLTKGGKGRQKKLKALERLRDKERNFVRTYNHTVTHQIVKFARDNHAGVINMELLEGFMEEEKSNFILRNWSYYELQQMLSYKSKREGMEVRFVDPYHTSQDCGECGHYEEGQRLDQAKFLCGNPDCTRKDKKGNNEEVNADYNAALNIAKSKKFVTRKEECEYFKKSQSESG